MTEELKPMMVHCADCGHSWAAAFFPMELAKFARIAKANSRCCARCGAGAKRIMCGNGLEQEQPA